MDINLSNLTPKQERTLCDAYRYIRQRAAWLRAQKRVSLVKERDTQNLTSAKSLVSKIKVADQTTNH